MSYPYWVNVAPDETVLDAAYHSNDPLVTRLARLVEQRDKEIESLNTELNRAIETMSKMRSKEFCLPYKKDMVALIKELKKDIRDDYRASGCEEDTKPSMDVTVGSNGIDRGWGYQTGDNSFTGGAYGFKYWAVVSIDRRSNSESVADEILDQLGEQMYV